MLNMNPFKSGETQGGRQPREATPCTLYRISPREEAENAHPALCPSRLSSQTPEHEHLAPRSNSMT